MKQKTKQIAGMLDMLPEQELSLAYEFIKRMVLAWDPYYTKVTAEEEQRLKQAEKEIENNEVYTFDNIDWD